MKNAVVVVVTHFFDGDADVPVRYEPGIFGPFGPGIFGPFGPMCAGEVSDIVKEQAAQPTCISAIPMPHDRLELYAKSYPYRNPGVAGTNPMPAVAAAFRAVFPITTPEAS